MADADTAEDTVQYEGTRVGVVTHYFDKISVAVVHAEETIAVGDSVKIYDKEGNVVVEQEIESMQVDGKDIKEAESGSEFGLKVDGVVKDGYTLFKQ